MARLALNSLWKFCSSAQLVLGILEESGGMKIAPWDYPETQGRECTACFGLEEVAPEQMQLEQCHLKTVGFVPYGTVLLPYFVSQGNAGSGLLVLSPAIFLSTGGSFEKEMLPHSGLKEPVLSNMYACLFSFLCLSLFIKCLLRLLWPRRPQLI